MSYGDFDRQSGEYVIQRPDTPAPWCNYLGSGAYRAIVSNTGGGFSYDADAGLKRILREHPRSLPEGRPGRYVYLRDRGTGDVWSPTWEPVRAELDEYECRHGLGYTNVQSRRGPLIAGVTYVVPIDEHLELWILRLRNTGEEPLALDVFTYAEFCLWGILKDLLNLQASKYVGIVRCEDGVILHETRSDSGPPEGDEVFVLHRAYFGCGAPAASYDVQRSEFIGPHRDESRPLAVERGRCSGVEYYGYDPVACLHVPVEIEPGGDDTIVFVLGADDEGTEWPQKLAHYTQPVNAAAALRQVKEYWAEHTSRLQVETPDPGANIVISTWNPYQSVNTFLTPRGYRDTCQDVLGIMHMLPREVRARLRVMLAHEFQSGATTHEYSSEEDFELRPGETRIFGDGELGFDAPVGATLEEQMGTPSSDAPLWMPPAVCHYVRETGDFDFLRERVRFVDGGESEVLDHLIRILAHSWELRGLHGLPLIRAMDWNDSLNMPEGSVSVWTGMQFVWAARELARLLRRPEVGGDPSSLEERAEEMAEAINRHAWDGRWYARAFFADGAPVGASSCEENQIDHMPQSWSIMTGMAPPERALSAMDAVRERCFTPYGLALLDPPYTRYDPRYGAISVVPASLKENGGIFNHPVNWAIIAECLLGRGERAWEYYHTMLPSTKNEIADTHQMEPYIFSQFVAGPYHPLHGRAGRAWMTGTATWALVAASQHILGMRPDYDGLRIDPCIPADWPGFSATRVFRGATYHIAVENPDRVSKGVRELLADGEPIDGNLIPAGPPGETRSVRVTMGSEQ
jgi:cellobiose phosphorylase